MEMFMQINKKKIKLFIFNKFTYFKYKTDNISNRLRYICNLYEVNVNATYYSMMI
jgi:hypothetical protein